MPKGYYPRNQRKTGLKKDADLAKPKTKVSGVVVPIKEFNQVTDPIVAESLPKFIVILNFDGVERRYECRTKMDMVVLRDALDRRYGAQYVYETIAD